MQTKKEKKKLQIAIKTYEALLKEGVEEFSLNNLLTSLSMSKGSFYHHFKSKDELFCEALNIGFTNIYLKHSFEKENKNFEEKLNKLFFLYLKDEKEINEYLSLVNQMYYLFSNEKNTYLYNFMQENYSILFKELEEVIKQEINEGNIKKEALDIIKPLVATADGMLTHSFMLKDYKLQTEFKNYLNSILKQYQNKL